jgi:hypothetical protein
MWTSLEAQRQSPKEKGAGATEACNGTLTCDFGDSDVRDSLRRTAASTRAFRCGASELNGQFEFAFDDLVNFFLRMEMFIHTLQKYLLNPPIKLAQALSLPLPGYALLETTGRKTGKPRRTPVGDGRLRIQFWLVAEHGMNAGYVRNIERDPRVRLKLRQGLRYRWHTGIAHLFRTMIRVSVNAGWLISCRAVLGMRGRCACSERNSSAFGLIWMADARMKRMGIWRISYPDCDSNLSCRASTSRWNFTALFMSATN